MVSIIRPIIPDVTTIPSVDPCMVANWVLLICVVGFIAFLTASYAAGRFNGNKKKTVWCFIGIAVAITIVLLCFFGCAATTFKGCVLLFALLLSSYEDIKTRECDDFVHVLIVVAAFIGIEATALPEMFLSALFVFVIMVVISLMNRGGIGGADIKLAGACTFLLGFGKGIFGLFFGLLLGVVINLIKQKKYKDAKFPMIPYLAVGFMTAYFI